MNPSRLVSSHLYLSSSFSLFDSLSIYLFLSLLTPSSCVTVTRINKERYSIVSLIDASCCKFNHLPYSTRFRWKWTQFLRFWKWWNLSPSKRIYNLDSKTCSCSLFAWCESYNGKERERNQNVGRLNLEKIQKREAKRERERETLRENAIGKES